MRGPHSDHFDGTSETTKGISNICFSRAVNSEKRNLEPRVAWACGGGPLPRHHTSGDPFQFHDVEVHRQFEIDQAIPLSGAESRGERNDETVQRARLT